MSARSEAAKAVHIYYSSAREDQTLLDRLDKHLALLRRQGQISTWHDGQVAAGLTVEQVTAYYLEKAQIVLLLMSPDYLASDRCYEQMEQLVARTREGTLHLLLVLLRPTPDLEQTPVGFFSPLPMRNRPVTAWSDQDEAFAYIANEVRHVSEQLLAHQFHPQPTAGILLLDPPHQHSTILQRTTLVKELYSRLLRPDTSSLILTGWKGVGKSMLAAQVFHYAEECRLRGESPFTERALWLRIEATGTIKDLITVLATALQQPLYTSQYFSPLYQQESSNLAPNLAAELFKLVNRSKRLIILDQFSEWLDSRTGKPLAKHAAVGEWLAQLNEHDSSSRVLLTSSIYPQGMRVSRQMYMQEFVLDGFGKEEGSDLLGLWGIQGRAKDLLRVIERCKGHALALVMLERLLRSRRITLATLLNNPAYRQLWSEDMQHNLLNYLYEYQLQDETERQLLEAFSIYREAVPWQAVHTILRRHSQSSENQTLTALGALQNYHLLQTYQGSNERYELHPLVTDFVQEQQSKQKGSVDIHMAHEEAAHYYERVRKAPMASVQHRDDTHLLIEIAWHYLQAEKWAQGYAFLEREHLFRKLQLQGKNAALLELYMQLLPSERWQPAPAQAAAIYNELGEIYSEAGQRKEALHSFEKALALCKTAGELAREIKILNNLGSTYRADGQIERALTCYQEAEQICSTLPNDPERGIILNNLGRVFQSQGQREKGDRKSNRYYRQARLYYEQALALHKAAGDQAEMARTLHNLGEVSALLQQTEKAYSYYRQALQAFRELGERRGEGIVCNNLGNFYRKQEKPQESIEYYLQAIHIFRDCGDRWQEGVTLRNVGRLYLLLQRREIVLACFLLAQDIFEELQYPEHGTIPEGIRLLVAGDQPFERLAAQVHPHAFTMVEDALKTQNIDFSAGN